MPAARPKADWILTFDDGPLAADLVSWNFDARELLGPLNSILATLRTYRAQPLKAVFYLRGPGYPWMKDGLPVPPDAVFAEGLRAIAADGHVLALHCYSHDPDIYRRLLPKKVDVYADADRAVQFFSQFGITITKLFRPPYGGGGQEARAWARDRRYRYHHWVLDSVDWVHHPDAIPPLFVNDPAAHLFHACLNLRIQGTRELLFGPRNKDVLFHVSQRTALHLREYLDTLSETTQAFGSQPEFRVASDYLRV